MFAELSGLRKNILNVSGYILKENGLKKLSA